MLAQVELEALTRELDKTHPGAAGSLREELEETLTVLRVGLPASLAGKQFRRVNGHMHLQTRGAALEPETTKTVPATCHDQRVNSA
ncbi:MAG: hypothetical protein ACYC1E_04255 [Propionibacteriaceae bacterium]